MKGLPESLTPLFSVALLQRETQSHRCTSVRLHTPATKALPSLLLLQIVLINCPIISSPRINQGSRALLPLAFDVDCNQADCELVGRIVMSKVNSQWVRALLVHFGSLLTCKLTTANGLIKEKCSQIINASQTFHRSLCIYMPLKMYMHCTCVCTTSTTTLKSLFEQKPHRAAL